MMTIVEAAQNLVARGDAPVRIEFDSDFFILRSKRQCSAPSWGSFFRIEDGWRSELFIDECARLHVEDVR
ncbi:MAG: hypothetical protein OIF56_15065 [Cohaesibacter sp.]|nr:hypothetical protein [Cohaesibacter sp.]